MNDVIINYPIVLVAAASSMALGFLWYGPLFGKYWIALSGMTEDQIREAKAKSMAPTYAISFVGSLLMAFVLSHALIFASAYLGVTGITAGLMAGFWNWLGFVVPVSVSQVLWDGKPWKLWFLNAGYYLVLLLIMGVILALWG